MCFRVLFAVVMLGLPASALAQPQPALNGQAQAMIGTWEFSNAERDKICTLTFKADPVAGGYKPEFDPNCVNLFPLVRDVTAWKYPDNDLLYLLDAQGRAVVSFSEVEDGIFEAPTPGIGVLFLQSAAVAPPPVKSAAQIAGNWSLKRGDGSVLCQLALTPTAVKDAFMLTVASGCDPEIVRLNFTQWRLDREELVLVPARGDPWRFESIDEATWGRLPESDNRIILVRR
jgi:hypothetical protein